MPSALEFHPFVGSFGAARRRGSSAGIILVGSFIGAVAGGTVLALMPAPNVNVEKPALAANSVAQANRQAENGKAPASIPAALSAAATSLDAGGGNDATAKAVVTNITIEDASAAISADKRCAEQVWPYLDRKCLSQSNDQKKTHDVRVIAPELPAKSTELAGGPAPMTRAAVKNVRVKIIELPHPVREEAKRLERNAKRMKHRSDRVLAKSAPPRHDRKRMAGGPEQHPGAPALGFAPSPSPPAAAQVFSPYIQ